MSIQQSPFGFLPDGRAVHLYTLRNRGGIAVKAITYGGRITEIHTPDRDGRSADVALGFGRLEDYLEDRTMYFGPILGRSALRIGGGRFSLDGIVYHLPTNEGNNTLHGGPCGFDKRLWTADPIEQPGSSVLRLTYFSPHMEQGFPGDVMATITYILTDQDEFRIEYAARADRPTPVSLSHHMYLNLAGAGSGQVLDHVLTIPAEQYLSTNRQSIPTGRAGSVRDTALDFTSPRRIGDRIGRGKANQDGGYDHFYLIPGCGFETAARVEHPSSGRALELATDWPGFQFYTANKLDGSVHGVGGAYGKYSGFTLEPMLYPDAVHHPTFPSPILTPGQPMHRTAVYRFLTV